MKKILYVLGFALLGGFTILTAYAQSTAAYTYSQNLTIGSQGADVVSLQQMLNTGGFLRVTPTGYFGSLTRAALAGWQASVGISPASGYFGPLTRAYLAANNLTVINNPSDTSPRVSISPLAASVAQGGKLVISWNSQNVPVNSVVALTLNGPTGGQIVLDASTTGSYTWVVPKGDAPLWTDDSYVQITKSGNYQITAEVYAPKGGYGGSMIARSPQFSVIASSISPTFKIVTAQ